MYTIVMDESKRLSQTQVATLYQNESLVDKIRFLLPLEYQGLDLSEFSVTLKYIDQGNVQHSEELTLSDTLYRDCMLCYYLPVGSDLTKFAGKTSIHLTLKKDDKYILHSSDTNILINPVKCKYHETNDNVTPPSGSDSNPDSNPDNPSNDREEDGYEFVLF